MSTAAPAATQDRLRSASSSATLMARCWRRSASESAERPTTSPSTGRCCSGSSGPGDRRDELELVGDSELIVRQVKGEYKVKDTTMRELHAEVKPALVGFDRWSIRHVGREENAEADRLVNEALDGG